MPDVSVFDKKIFNGEVFKGYIDRLPNENETKLIKSKAIRPRPDLAKAMSDQVGGNYLTTPLFGNIEGTEPQNYDGVTNMQSSSTVTYKHSRIVIGRMNMWTERDFSYDITGGKDFIDNIAQQIKDYQDEVKQNNLVSILKGVFAMTDPAGAGFVAAHTADITGTTSTEGVTGVMDSTSLNTAMQKACGDKMGKFSLAIMHSAVATNLANLKLLNYLKYNDANGLERDTTLATLNGRLVLIDDTMPVVKVPDTYIPTTDATVDPNKTYYTEEGVVIEEPADESITTYYEVATYKNVYTTYVLGDGAIEYTDCGAKVPFEVGRDPSSHGGQDSLYSRMRFCYSPFGISFTMTNMSSLSPVQSELEDGDNWELDNSQTAEDRKYIPHKLIPIAQIVSLG